jgi:hypothetical protein
MKSFFWRDHFSSLAFIKIFPRSNFETRQLVFARMIASMNLLCDNRGSRARTLRWMFITVQPAASSSKVIVVVVTMAPAVCAGSAFDRTREKLLARALASNSAESVSDSFLVDTFEAGLDCFSFPFRAIAPGTLPFVPPFQQTEAFRMIKFTPHIRGTGKISPILCSLDVDTFELFRLN